MKILLFGGTTEGRILSEKLHRAGIPLTVCVATDLGAEELRAAEGLDVRAGRLDADGIRALLTGGGYDLCVDATHPYAEEISRTLAALCGESGVPLKRILRGAGSGDALSAGACTTVASAREAAAYLADRPGNILLATGMKELPAFAGIDPERLIARVLPTQAGIAACEAAGIPHRNIVAMQGPFSRELNEVILRRYGVRYLVTKDGGAAGGFAEKAEAARSCGAELVLIARPREIGDRMTMEEFLAGLGIG